MQTKRKFRIILAFAVAISCFLGMQSVLAQTVTPKATQVPMNTPTVTVTVIETPSETPTPTPTATAIVREEAVQIKIVTGTQSAWNKQIPVKVIVTPNKDGSKLTINWQKKAGLVATPASITLNDPRKGQSYTASFSITPQATGYQRTVTEVILTTNVSNFVSSQELVYNLNKDKVILPISSAFSTNQMIMYVSMFVVFIILIPGGLYFMIVFFKKNIFPKWYARQIQGTPS